MSFPPRSSSSPEEKIYSIGTLRYTQRGLYVLFFWLMWNDFSITLLEQVNGLVGFLYRNNGATDSQIATFGSIGGLISMWINPWFSTWSDRARTRYGRRRPFVFVATPFFALFLMLIPYMPGVYHALLRYPLAAAVLHHLPIKGEVIFIFLCGFVAGIFNSMVLSVFGYLYWDVVPANVLGRFNALAKIITSLAGLIWSFFLFGQSEHHMKGIFVGVSTFCLVFYMISTWQVKEGEYPPPDRHVTGHFLAPVRAYFVECFSQTYFLWIFFGFTLYQINNSSGLYRMFYLHYGLGMSLDSLGKAGAVPSLLCLALAFVVGAATDKINPVRLMAPAYLAWGVINFAGYFLVCNVWTYLVWSTCIGLVTMVSGIVTVAFTVQVYPMEKLGQFCSASAISQQLACHLTGPFMARFFDATSDRVAFLWSADFLFAAALVFRKVHANWAQRKGHPPVPHAG